jgi:hypothetical protein
MLRAIILGDFSEEFIDVNSVATTQVFPENKRRIIVLFVTEARCLTKLEVCLANAEGEVSP